MAPQKVAENAEYCREGIARNAGYINSGRFDLIIFSKIPSDGIEIYLSQRCRRGCPTVLLSGDRRVAEGRDRKSRWKPDCVCQRSFKVEINVRAGDRLVGSNCGRHK